MPALRSLFLAFTTAAVVTAGVQAPAAATAPAGDPDRKIVRHTVQRGESVTGLAKRYRAWTREVRSLNGLDAQGTIRVGQVLRIPVMVSRATSSTSRSAARTPKGIGTPTHDARLMKQRGWRHWQLSRAEIRKIIIAKAKRYGVPPEVALAIAWQESGWQQPMRSSAGALGVMQVLPETGTWMEQYAGRELNLRGTYDNITAGVILLHVLRKQTGPKKAIAAYYQGLRAVRRHGFFAETELSSPRSRHQEADREGLEPRGGVRTVTAYAFSVSSTLDRRTSLLASAALLAMAACWGSTFYLIHDLLDRVPVADFLAVRFAIASLVLFVLAPRALARLDGQARKHAVVLGALYGGAQILQTIGLAHTAASVSGFITGLYVVLTPLFAALILRTRIVPMTWLAVLLAMIGLGVLTLSGLSLGYGEAVTLVASGLYALHIVGLGAWSKPQNALGMSLLQMIVIAVICTVAALPGGIQTPDRTADWISMVYMAAFAGALALLGQTWAQSHLPPTRSAIIMSMEPVFAAFFAVLLGGESLTARMLLGGGLVVVAMLIVEIAPRRKIEGEVSHIAVWLLGA